MLIRFEIVSETQPDLSESQRQHWEQQLESARKAVEVAERVLGIIAVKETTE